MPQIGNISVSIVDPDTRSKFEEYKVVKNGTVTECHIESKVGQKFKVVMKIHEGDRIVKELYVTHLEIDGEKVVPARSLGRLGRGFDAEKEYAGTILGPNEQAPFVFAESNFTDTGPMMDTKRLSALGSITLFFHRIKQIGRARKVPKRATKNISPIKQKSINELVKKPLLTHSVKSGIPEIRQNHLTYRNYDYIDAKTKPLYTFKFFYRSQILEAMGVVAPATPAPDSGPPAEELAQPNVEDTELSNKITQLKNELHELELRRGAGRIKREPQAERVLEHVDLTAPPVKKRRATIDLTS